MEEEAAPVAAPAAPQQGMDLMEALREVLKNSIIADGITKGNNIHFHAHFKTLCFNLHPLKRSPLNPI